MPNRLLRSHLGVILGVACVLLLASCTSEPRIVESQDTTSTTAEPDPTTTTTSAPDPTTTETSEVQLPGELTDFGPGDGDALAVVGVTFNDRLNVRNGPGVEFEIITDLSNRSDDVIATGQNRLLESSIWYEVTVNNKTGWANGSFLGYLGRTRNGTSDFGRWFGQDFLPAGPSLTELGQIVVDSLKSDAPPSRVTITSPPNGNVVIYDLLDLGDDSVFGLRVTTTAELTGEDETKRRITRVDEQVICGRGVTPDGLCV